jgi:putative DNA primase/helicase
VSEAAPRVIPPLELATILGAGQPNGSKKRRLLTTPAAQVQRQQVEWLEPGRVPVGLVTVLAGMGGLGKSQWACWEAAKLSRGELGAPGVTLLATAEDDPHTTVKPRLEALEANVELIRFLTIKTGEDHEDGIAIPNDIDLLEAAVRETGARLLVIDPLVAHLPTEIDSHRDQSVRRALAPLYRLATATGCAVIAIIHLNKSQGLTPLARLNGSGGFGNAARSVLLFGLDPDDPDSERGHRRILAHIKCNVAPLAPSLLYQVEPIVLPAEANAPLVETSRLRLLGESSIDGHALLSDGNEDERSARNEAEEFLLDYLGDGTRHPAAEIYKEAGKLQISPTKLKQAKAKLKVKGEKAGFTRGWEWWLPQGANTKGLYTHSSDSSHPSPIHHEETEETEETEGTNPPHALFVDDQGPDAAEYEAPPLTDDEIDRLAAEFEEMQEAAMADIPDASHRREGAES